ncbi:MAG: hypothetical protein H6Q31_3399 [Bacteroidetes bacterium]|nr:hypothetical protein [Bacteroidota bacterium]
MFDTHLNYYLRRALSTHVLLQEALVYKTILLETLLSRDSDTLRTEEIPFRYPDGLPPVNLRFIVPRPGSNQGHPALRFDVVDLGEKRVNSWSVSLPPSRRANTLFKTYVRRYKPAYLRMRLPFMGLGIPHCSHMSKTGYICASNGFYNYVIDTHTNTARIFPEDYLSAEPMHYSKQGNFSSDSAYWYFVRWPLAGWADLIDGPRNCLLAGRQVRRVLHLQAGALCSISERLVLLLATGIPFESSSRNQTAAAGHHGPETPASLAHCPPCAGDRSPRI